MGLLSRAEKEHAKKRGKKLRELDSEDKKYIHHVSDARRKVISDGIKSQRKVLKKKLAKKLKVPTLDRIKKPKKSSAKPTLKKKKPVKKSAVKKVLITKGGLLTKSELARRQKKLAKDLALKEKPKTKKKVLSKAKVSKPAAPKAKAKVGKKKLFSISSIRDSIQEQLHGKARVMTEAQKRHDTQAYIQTGISGFDSLLEKGIPRGAAVLVAGGAGSGKTIFALQSLNHHALNKKKCLYMSFEESEDKLVKHMETFGWNPKKLVKSGNLLIKRFNPYEITRSVDALLMKSKGELLIDVKPITFPKNFKPDFIVVDSLTAIASAFSGKEDTYRIYIEQLFRFFEEIGATSYLITETEQVPKIFSTTGVEEFLADAVIVLYNIKRGNIRERAIEVLKLRGAGHQHKLVATNITSDGIEVFPEQEIFGDVQ